MEQGLEGALPHLVDQDRCGILVRVALLWITSGRPLSRAAWMCVRKTRVGDVARRPVVMVVEPRLADADAFGMLRELDDALGPTFPGPGAPRADACRP